MTITRIGVVGLGSMGTAMARRLIEAGFDVTITNRTQNKMDPLAAAGAKLATLPADAAQDADLVLVSVRGERAVEEVLFDHGSIAETLREGGYVLDTSTTSPQFSRAATARMASYGLTRVEGCILGDPARASVGKLRILFGGSTQDLQTMSDVVEALASSVVHTGSVGTASRFKVMHQTLLADGFETAAHALVRELSSRPLQCATQPQADAAWPNAIFGDPQEGVAASA
jgi:3-hydroxyisobutyrate dehydrogenase-like beta-hydroxyacid dehydrogenase